MCETTPTPTPSAPRKPRARRWWALALIVILALIPLHWLLFQGQEVVPGVIARPAGPCDVEWFEQPHLRVTCEIASDTKIRDQSTHTILIAGEHEQLRGAVGSAL